MAVVTPPKANLLVFTNAMIRASGTEPVVQRLTRSKPGAVRSGWLM